MQHWKYFIAGIFISLLWTVDCSAKETIVLQLRWDHQFQFAGYYAANWQGYYAEEDLKIEIRSALTDDGRILSAVKEVAAERADFGIGAADILKANDVGPPLSVVATIFQQSAAAFYLKQDTPFRSLADLTRLRVARRVNDLIDVELQAMLLNEGIDPESVTAHQHQPGVAHLLSNAAQVIPGYRTTIPYLMSTREHPFREILPADYGVDFYGDSLFTRTALTQNNPELIERFRRASLKGWQYALNHPEEMAVKISSDLPRRAPLDHLADFNRFQAQAVKELMLYPIVAIGNSNPERWHRMHAFLKSIGQVQQDLNLRSFIFAPERLRMEKQQRLEKILVWLAFAVVGLFGGIALWTISLKRQVEQRTSDLQQELAVRQQIEKNLRSNEQLLRKIAENYPSYLSIIEADLTVGFTSGKEFTKLGLNPDDFLGLSLEQVFREQTDLVRSYYQQVFAGHEVSFELYMNGQYQLYHVVPLYEEEGNIPRILAVVENITERKQAEMDLKASEERFRRLADNAPEIIYRFQLVPERKFEYVNQVVTQITGYSPEDHYANPNLGSELVHPDDRDLLQSAGEELGLGHSLTLRWVHKNGTIIWTEQHNIPIYDEYGALVAIEGIARDVTVRKLAEEQLRYQAYLLEHVSDAIISSDANFVIQSWNKAAEEIYGWTAGEVIGENVHDVLKSSFPHGSVEQGLQQFFQEGYWKGEVIHYCKDGSRVDIGESMTLLKDRNGKPTGVVSVNRDITQRKQAERALKEYSEHLEAMVEERTRALQETQEKLLRQEKLAVLGQLAGSVAHELRHPLGVISNAVYFLKMSLPDANPTTIEYLEMLTAEIRKSDKIISDLLDFSRNHLTGASVKTEIQIALLLAEVLAEQPPPEGIGIFRELAPDLPPLFVDAQQIKQVLANLLLNAYQAMPEGGSVSISTQLRKVTSEDASDKAPGTGVMISVSDTGCGMAPDTLKKVFEPLFTTRTKGIGLGLAICKNLVEANGGEIFVESVEGRGSTFAVTLPLITNKEA